MKNLALSFLLMFLSFAASAQKAVLVEEIENKTDGLKDKVEVQKKSFFKEKKQLSEIFEGEYASTYEMRSKRRVGIGVSAAGQLGLVGAFTELNFAMDDSAVVGFGWGSKYSSLTMQWKHVFGGHLLAPYMTLGYSRWYGSGQSGAITETSPSFFSERFLNPEERQTGKFAKNLFIPSFGLQYNLLSGPYTGASVFAEVMLIYNTSNFDQVPTGSFGVMYYF